MRKSILVARVVEVMAMTYLESDPMSPNARPPQVCSITLPRSDIRGIDRHLCVGHAFAPAGSEERGAAAEKDDDPEEHPYSGIWENNGPHSIGNALGLELVAQRWSDLEERVLDGMCHHFRAKTVGSSMDPRGSLYRELLIGCRDLFTMLQQKLVLYWGLKAHRNTSIQCNAGAGIRTVDWDTPLRVILGALCTVAVRSEVLVVFAHGFFLCGP